MALRLGDTTARDLGRLTLNPIPHIDPVGSILVPLFSLAVAGRVFIAWAKPVPVNPLHFSHYRRDDILVSIVGPLSNIIIAACCTFMFIILVKVDSAALYGDGLARQAVHFFMSMFYGGISLNIVLAVFNMIPIPPLDGSHVVASLLPHGLSQRYRSLGFLGIFAVLVLMRWEPFAIFFSNMIEVLEFPFHSLIHAFV